MAAKRIYKSEVLNCRISPELKAYIESIVEVEGITISEWVIKAYKDAIKKYSDYISTAPHHKYYELYTTYAKKRAALIKKKKILPGQKPRYLADEKSEIATRQVQDDQSILKNKKQDSHLTSLIAFKVTQAEYDKIREASDNQELTISEYLRRILKCEI